MTLVLTKPDDIRAFQHLARYHALALEAKGIKRSGRSVLSICKQVYGLKSRTAVKALPEFHAILLARYGIEAGRRSQ